LCYFGACATKVRQIVSLKLGLSVQCEVNANRSKILKIHNTEQFCVGQPKMTNMFVGGINSASHRIKA
jgi:hypothetical protein